MSEAAAASSPGPSSKSAESAKSGSGGELARSPWVFAGASLLVALALLLGLHFGVGVAFDGPTLALAAACIVLFWTLRAMWGVVVALSRPAVETFIVEAELGAEHSTIAELREEKRRVLRAIKELEFDHAMGKLSDEDFREVGDRYRLRAIEVLRLLDKSDALHPTLAEHLAALGLERAAAGDDEGAKAASEAEAAREDEAASGATAAEEATSEAAASEAAADDTPSADEAAADDTPSADDAAADETSAKETAAADSDEDQELRS